MAAGIVKVLNSENCSHGIYDYKDVMGLLWCEP